MKTRRADIRLELVAVVLRWAALHSSDRLGGCPFAPLCERVVRIDDAPKAVRCISIVPP
jgi:hypothetical protein